jgi:hypothetical protein
MPCSLKVYRSSDSIFNLENAGDQYSAESNKTPFIGNTILSEKVIRGT